MNILGISGSIREKSHNTALLKAAQELKPDDMEIEIYSIGDLPLYNGDLEKNGFPDNVQKFKDKVSGSDGLLIASPEYNYSFTGILKNAIDWASRPPSEGLLKKKPFALMGVSGGMSGTIRSQMHFRQIAAHLDMTALNKPEVYIPFGGKKFDEHGNLTDEATRENLQKFLEAFSKLIYSVSEETQAAIN
ncbi:MAG TPA: NADPH-dependent FMN reductase [Ignavibacteria bacterium]|nr:NADPH-dependent FMN reductase [Ignavibacteria bacterium]